MTDREEVTSFKWCEWWNLDSEAALAGQLLDSSELQQQVRPINAQANAQFTKQQQTNNL